MALSYQEAANAAVVLRYGATGQAIVSGLNSMKLPGGQRTMIEVKEFRQTSRQRAGQANRTNLEFGGNAAFNDVGQMLLKTYFDNNSTFGKVGSTEHCRVYINGTSTSMLTSDFLALDTGNDTASIFQVSAYDFPAADSDGLFPFQSGLAVGGRTAFFTEHHTASTLTFATTGIISDSASGLGDFEVGQTIIIENSSSNDGIGVISAAGASQITVTGLTMAAEATGATVTLHAGR
jgi:hypothetical protein